MKQLFTTFIALLFAAGLYAQAPQYFNYQAVVRNSSNELITNSSVGLRIQLLKGSEFGAASYVETHTPQTNSNGVFSLQVGTGTVTLGDFSTVDWSDGPYFLKTEVDPQGGTNYSITSVTQMVSVPYALYAEKAAEVEKTPTAFNVYGGTFQDLPAGETTTIDFTSNASGFTEDAGFSFDDNTYTAPVDGVYFFESFVTLSLPTNGRGASGFYLRYLVNGRSKSHLRNYTFTDERYQKIIFNTTIVLKQGDKVSLAAESPVEGIETMGANSHGTVRMTGFKVD